MWAYRTAAAPIVRKWGFNQVSAYVVADAITASVWTEAVPIEYSFQGSHVAAGKRKEMLMARWASVRPGGYVVAIVPVEMRDALATAWIGALFGRHTDQRSGSPVVVV
eukprot:CAMPEP_0195602806 /NCGR_PEP_ID=MMETSP0815-20121206/5795_1 /TAXON_ID=97485 /ORGANISM="Prymnesium parvum, Strain Texoma1" /LENGTH=107 /DNA_ID=CAMNT_0040742399 /DNA_START=226 /DNA_END=550 /DNA_ORIENTATION=+